jgi:two-component sensor histidine kinase
MDKPTAGGRFGRLVQHGLRPRSAAALSFALLCVGAATLLRLAVDPIAPDAVPYATYFPAILIAAFIGGGAAGTLATVTSALAAWFVFVSPRVSMAAPRPDEIVSLALFLLAGFVIVWVADHYRRVLKRLGEDEAHRQIVVADLSHRVKNKLATVYAILRHELRGHRDVWASAEGRLRALSAADDFLAAAEDGHGVALTQILAMELAPYGNARVSMTGVPVALAGKIPSVFSLVVHELATNAAKYGALSGENGSIDISWRADGEHIALEWKERGGPPVTPPQKRSFGASLIERSLDPFKGSAHLDYAPEGVVCRMRLPCAPGAA